MKRKNKLEDLILPIAAMRGESLSNEYFRSGDLQRHCGFELSPVRWSQPAIELHGSTPQLHLALDSPQQPKPICGNSN